MSGTSSFVRSPVLSPATTLAPQTNSSNKYYTLFKALLDGRLEAELTPVSFVAADGSRVELSVDEHPRPDTRMETISRLPPVFQPSGIVTAASSSVCLRSIYISLKSYRIL